MTEKSSKKPGQCTHVGAPQFVAGGMAQCACGAWMQFSGGLLGEHEIPPPGEKVLTRFVEALIADGICVQRNWTESGLSQLLRRAELSEG